jgi:predicted DNA-binding antitoxin AbrB/MazE fold protein
VSPGRESRGDTSHMPDHGSSGPQVLARTRGPGGRDEGADEGAAVESKVMRVLKAHVRSGQLVVDEPIDLPEGSEVQVALVEDELDEAERAELESALEESEAEYAAGRGVSEDELWARLRAQR